MYCSESKFHSALRKIQCPTENGEERHAEFMKGGGGINLTTREKGGTTRTMAIFEENDSLRTRKGGRGKIDLYIGKERKQDLFGRLLPNDLRLKPRSESVWRRGRKRHGLFPKRGGKKALVLRMQRVRPEEGISSKKKERLPIGEKGLASESRLPASRTAGSPPKGGKDGYCHTQEKTIIGKPCNCR